MGRRIDPVTSAYDVETLKDFVHTIGYGIDGTYGDPKAGQRTVWQRWKDFTAGIGLKYHPIPPEPTLSVTNVRDLDSVQRDLHCLRTVLHYTADWNVPLFIDRLQLGCDTVQ